MRHILMIAPSLQRGGMERQLSLFLHNFDRKKLKITLALFRKKIAYEIPPDVTVVDLEKKSKLDLAFIRRFYNLLKNREYDIINSKLSGINEYLMAFSKFMTLPPVVMEIRSSGVFQQPYYKKMKLLSSTSNSQWPVVCNSSKAFDELKTLFPEREIKWIKNGIDSELFRNNTKIKDEQLKVAFIGRIDPGKNIETFISAINLLSDEFKTKVNAEIMGTSSSDTYFDSLKSLIKNNNLQDLIKILPTRNDIWNYYNEIDILVLPSFYEGTPNVLLEAMCSERICLISEGANSDNFLPDKYIFETLNPKVLAEKLTQILNSSNEERKDIGRNNRQFVIENYSVDLMVNNLTTFLLNQ
jgi:glycosyltransferase involved in cell wall biosynthesis